MSDEIYNTHGQLVAAAKAGFDKRKLVAVTYHPYESRSAGSHAAKVWSPFFKTDPSAAWYDYESKTFCGNRDESVPKALAWATEKYDVTEWARNRMGDMLPAEVHRRFPLRKRDRK